MKIEHFLTIVSMTHLATANEIHSVCQINKIKNHALIDCSNKHLKADNWTQFHLLVSDMGKTEKSNQRATLLLEGNAITSLGVFPTMNSIVEISLKNNLLEESQPGAFQNLHNLKLIDLSYNRFTGESLTKDIFRGNPWQDDFEPLLLEYLYLANNKITILQKDLFIYLPNLISLNLSHNPLKDINPDLEQSFHHLRQLKILNLAHTQLKHVPALFFAAMPLRMLFLNENNFDQVPRSISSLGRTLQYLNLNDNPIPEINADSFYELSCLEELHLNGMKKLQRMNRHAFCSLVKLKILHCSYNPLLRFIDSDAFSNSAERSNLEELYINNNGISNLSESTLFWEKLRVLDIRENPWNCSCAINWLLNFTERRQGFDPEANIGVRYPLHLRGRLLTNIGTFHNCIPSNERKFSVNTFLIFTSTFSRMLCAMILFFIICLIVIKFKTRFNLTLSRSSVVSRVRYEPVEVTR